MFEAFNVNLRHLRVLPAIAEAGSMNAAAEVVGISQPALAQGLAKLEVHFGQPLFTRAPDGMKPTAAGWLVIDRARAIQSRLGAAIQGLPRAGRRGFERADNLLTATQLRGLVSLADGGSFLGAARVTGASQSALHRAVRELEAICGVTLAERRGQRVALTAHGQRLARHFRIIGAELTAARQDLTGDEGAGQISIGAMPLCRARLLPSAIARMASKAAEFRIDVAEGSYAELAEPLRDGRIDLAIGALRDPCPPDLKQHRLFTDRLAVVARKGHPLAGQAGLTIRHLRRYPWVIGRRGSPLRAHWEQMFAGELPRAPVECGSALTIRGVLAETDYLTLLSPDQVVLEIQSGLLTLLPMRLPAAQRTIGVITRADWRPTRLQQRFLELLQEIARANHAPEFG